jgi:hypothetical protein
LDRVLGSGGRHPLRLDDGGGMVTGASCDTAIACACLVLDLPTGLFVVPDVVLLEIESAGTPIPVNVTLRRNDRTVRLYMAPNPKEAA